MAMDGLDTDGACGGGYREEEEDVVPELPFSRKVSTEAQMEKKRLISLVLENKYKNNTAGPMDKDWMVGEACIANWNVDKKWYRAEVWIMKRRKKQVWVHFVDYGSFYCCHQKELRRNLFMTDMPIQSVTLKMEGVVPLNSMQWTKDGLACYMNCWWIRS